MSSTPAQALAGRCLWLTRPLAQILNLQTQLQQLGATVLSLPLLLIEPVPLCGVTKQRIMNLDRYELVFYVSTNAATLGLAAIGDYWPQYPLGISNFAVGPATAAVLQQQGLAVSFPTTQMSSEAMLALPALQQIRGKQALIIRGVGGREILGEALLARGAKVDYAELYLRTPPPYAPAFLREQHQQYTPHAVIISSAEALDNLHTLTAPLQLWAELPLVVSSERLAALASKLGNQPALVLAGATDAAIIDGVLAHFAPPLSL